MKFIQLFIIVLIIFLFLYISYRLIQKQNMRYIYEGFQEGLDSKTITNTTDKMLTMPLKQYCIKASYNSAYDGSKVTIDQLKYVMSKGCRFLDFELYLNNDKVYVNYSTDPTYTTFLNTNINEISFINVMDKIMDKSPYRKSDNKTTYEMSNPEDPLFIQLRIKSTNKDVYSKVASILENYRKQDKIYGRQIDGNTTLKELKNKIIIVMDKSINPKYPEEVLSPFVNIITGGNTWSSQQYSLFKNQKTKPPKTNDDFKTTNVTEMKLLMPDVSESSSNPPNPFSLIRDYGVQTIAYKFYNNDAGLILYESIFSEYQSAFVPLAYVLQFVKTKIEQQEDSNITYGTSFVK